MLKKGIISFFEYLLMLMIILEFNTPYIEFPVVVKIQNIFIVFSSIVLIYSNRHQVSSANFLFIAALLIGAIIPLLNVYSGRITSFIKIYYVFFPLFLTLIFSYSNDEGGGYELLNKFSNIVIVLTAISLFFWLFGSILGIISSSALIPNSWASDRFITTYYGLYFETQELEATAGTMSIIRNSGIFNEAPMHNMILCVSLSIELFVCRNLRFKRIIIIVIAIFTTISTTGLIFLFVTFFIKGYFSLSSKLKLQMILLLPLLLLVSLIAISNVLENKKELSDGSYNSRSKDIVKCIEVGMENPIFGSGIMHKHDSSERFNYGYSNSLFGVFAHGGIYFLLLYLASFFFIPIWVYLKEKDLQFPMLVLSYFLLFTFTVSQYNILTIFMVSFSLSKWYSMVFLHSSFVKE